MELNKQQIKIVDDARDALVELGLEEDINFAILYSQRGSIKNRENLLEIQFRLKGNKKAIALLEESGWAIDKRYKNDDGNPSMWNTEHHDKDLSYKKVVMIRMKYILAK